MSVTALKTEAPKVSKFEGIKSIPAKNQPTLGCTSGDIMQWVKDHAGGNFQNVIIRPVEGLDKKNPFPFERTMFEKDGTPNHERRAYVMWALANSGKKEYTLQDCSNDHKKIKSPATGVLGLVNALNGGQSASAKATWGKNYVELVVKPKS